MRGKDKVATMRGYSMPLMKGQACSVVPTHLQLWCTSDGGLGLLGGMQLPKLLCTLNTGLGLYCSAYQAQLLTALTEEQAYVAEYTLPGPKCF